MWRISPVCASLLILLSCAGDSSEAVRVQREMGLIGDEMRERENAGDRPGALEQLIRMAELDREHPKPYALVALRHARWRALDDAPGFVDILGPVGPGRVFAQAMIQYSKKENDEALAGLQEALRRYEQIGHVAGQGYSHVWLAQTLKKTRRYDEAMEHARRARPFQDSLKDPRTSASVVATMGDIAAGQRKLEEAAMFYREALEIARPSEDRSIEAQYLRSLGSVLRDLERFPDSCEAFRTASALSEREGAGANQYKALLGLARSYSRGGQYEESVATYERAVLLNRDVRGEVAAVGTQSLLASELIHQHRYDEANALSRESLETLARIEQDDTVRHYELMISSRLGTSLLNQARYSEAVDVLERTVRAARDREDEKTEANALTDLAKIHGALGQLTRALNEQLTAHEIYERRDDDAKRLISLTNLGAFYADLGDRTRAREYMRRALELARRLGSKHSEARNLLNLATMRAEDGELNAALDGAREARGLWTELDDAQNVAFSWVSEAEMQALLGRIDAAVAAADSGRRGFEEVGDVEGQTWAMTVQGEAQARQGRPDEALKLFSASLEQARRFGYPEERVRALLGRSRTQEEIGNRDQALEDLLAALDAVESTRSGLQSDEFRMSFLASQAEIYEHALVLSVLREQDTTSAAAFHLAERSRARGLVDLLAEAGANLKDSIAPELVARERELTDEVSAAAARLASSADEAAERAARADLDAAEQLLRQFQIELRQSAPIYADFTYPAPITLATAQSGLLGPDETLLSYYVGAEHAYLWIVNAGQARRVDLPPPQSLDRMVTALLDRASRPGLAAGARSAGVAQAAALGEVLLPSEIPDGHRLLIAPDGPLHHVPFDVLHRGGRFLIEDHEVVVIPSATALHVMRGTSFEPAPDGFFGLGSPDVDAAEYPALPDSARALLRIAGMFPEDRRVVLSGAEATREELMAQELDQFWAVHFGTHGWLDSDAGAVGLLLTPAAGEIADFLTLDDVFALDLAAEVVVLSACQSGKGELLRGEGLVSLSRAFLYAGSRGMVVSLWNVNDRSSADFMESLYGHLVRGRSVSEAMRQAKLEFIHSDLTARRAPYRWAPFVLVGDPTRASNKVNRTAAAATPQLSERE